MAPTARAQTKNPRSWDRLGLPAWCVEAVASMGFTEPTPSQAAAIPLFLANSDVVVEAPTGSGKSLAFLIPLVVRILRACGEGKAGAAAGTVGGDDGDAETATATPIKRGHIAAVVMAPTRELADQLHRVLLDLVAFHPPTAAILPYIATRPRITQAQRGGGGGGGKGSKFAAAVPSAHGQDIAGDDDSGDPLTRLAANSRRPQTAGPVIVPQLVVGGTASKPAADLALFARQGTNVLVGTPGRLAEMLSSRAVNATASFEALVLDEADRLLDLGFASDLQRILACVPKQRRTFLCSASVNDAIGELIKVNLRNPKRVVVRVQTRKQPAAPSDGQAPPLGLLPPPPAAAGLPSDVEEKKTPASLLNTYVVLPSSHKLPALLQLLVQIEPRPLRTLVFLASCFSVKYFSAVLPAAMPPGYTVLSLHGKLEPHVRERAYAKFLSTTSPCVLFTTDVASRGLDVPNVDLVVNIDPPTDPKTFLHRCGRTGRAGRRGLAVTMLRPGREADDYVPFLAVRKTPVEPLAEAVPALAGIADKAAAAAADLTHTMRQQVWADRELHQLSQRAFVSWARTFQEHQAASIFRPGDLDWPELGHAWGLARLPKMPELRAAGISDRTLGLGGAVDVDAIPFKDKTKEKRRQAEIREAAAAAAAGGDGGAAKTTDRADAKKRNASWSTKHGREDLRTERREKKQRKRAAERLALMTLAEREEQERTDALVAEVRRRNQAAADLDAMAAEKAALAGKMADDEFAGFGD